MRNALTLLIAPVLASLSQPADACGSYGFTPRLMQVSTHYAQGGTRAFVITNEKVANDQPWVRLAPRSYDSASVVDVDNPEHAIEMTLVGPAGTKIVSSRERVYLSQTFLSRAPSVAFEIRAPKGEFAIAMAGTHADASWISLGGQRTGSAADISWVEAQGVTPKSVNVEPLTGAGLEAVTVHQKTGERITFVRGGGVAYAQFEGWLLGGISVTGERFVVVSKDGAEPRAIRI